MPPSRALVLEVAPLLRRPGQRRHESLTAELGDLAVSGGWVPSGEPVRLELDLEAVDRGVVVSGRAEAPWEGRCRRCLRPVRGQLVADVIEIFEPKPVEGETFPLREGRIDLEPVARDAVVLGLPVAPLCRPGCAGLCARCGADLNAGPCACPDEESDPRWAALDALRLDD